MQSKAVAVWLYIFLGIISTLQPLTLILKFDVKLEMPTWVLCLPVTIIWFTLFVSIVVQQIKICQYWHEVHNLHRTRAEYKANLALQTPLKGHNTKHSSLFKMTKFMDKTTMFVQMIVFISYVPVFLKLHFEWFSQVKYARLHWIGTGTLVVAYGYEILSEIVKNCRNPIKIPKGTSCDSEQEISELKKVKIAHWWFLVKFNLGLVPNFVGFTFFTCGFNILLAQRMDKETTLSLFVILIPLWLLLLYVTCFLVLVGLASKNHKIKTCEKVLLALVPPIGFITSAVLVMCCLEGYFSSSLWVLFMPEVLSALFLYLYVRCLVKPNTGSRVQNDPRQ